MRIGILTINLVIVESSTLTIKCPPILNAELPDPKPPTSHLVILLSDRGNFDLLGLIS